MGGSRKPKPTGRGSAGMAPRTPGPLGHNDAGTPHGPRTLRGDTPGALGCWDYAEPLPSWRRGPSLLVLPPFDMSCAHWHFNSFSAATTTVTVSEANEKEFELLKGKIEETTATDYVKHRNEHFGSAAAYEEYAAEADKELTETKKLSGRIELSGDAQKVFYRWVRKAYEKKGVKNIPALILQGESEELTQALAKVQASYSKDFMHGGFNPRPQKNAKYRYRLGTLSEHALGMAVDIEDKKNPIISIGDWKFIEELAGKTVDRRRKRWQEHPQDLWQDIKDLNDAFVTAARAKVKKIEDERAAAQVKAAVEVPTGSDKPAAKKQPAPLDEIFRGHDALKKWTDGFFTLEWSLVEQLYKHGFLWGATFTNTVDLHHFEL